MTDRPIIYVLCGLPASGKSTWRSKHIAEQQTKPAVISLDDAVDAYAATSGLSYHDSYMEIVTPALQNALMDQLSAALEKGDDVIVDRTNLTPQYRGEILSRVPDIYTKVGIWFPLTVEQCMERVRLRAAMTGKHIPEEVLTKMHLSATQPTTTEGFDIVRLP